MERFGVGRKIISSDLIWDFASGRCLVVDMEKKKNSPQLSPKINLSFLKINNFFQSIICLFVHEIGLIIYRSGH